MKTQNITHRPRVMRLRRIFREQWRMLDLLDRPGATQSELMQQFQKLPVETQTFVAQLALRTKGVDGKFSTAPAFLDWALRHRLLFIGQYRGDDHPWINKNANSSSS